MMNRDRRAFVVYVDLDPVPGVMYSQESAQTTLRRILNEAIPHYNPSVALAPNDIQPENSNYYCAVHGHQHYLEHDNSDYECQESQK